MYLYEDGIKQAREASETFKRLGDTAQQALCLINLAYLLLDDNQLDAAEEAASCAINHLLEKGEKFKLCQGHSALGDIYSSKGEREKAIHHFEVVREIASPFNWHDELFWVHYALANLFFGEGRFDEAHAHIECAKSQVVDNAYNLGRAMELQAGFWYRQCMPEKARFEASHAAEVYEKIGAIKDIKDCISLLRKIDRLDLDGEH